jgi:hypothetical protein
LGPASCPVFAEPVSRASCTRIRSWLSATYASAISLPFSWPSAFSCPDEPGPHLTAFLTSAAIFFSSAGVNSSSAKEVGHILPSSRFAASWKPNVEYLDLY